MRLLGPAEIRALADRLGVRPSKRLGQNFVVEPGTVRKIASLAALEPRDVVLEVGPGLGSLTLALLDAGASQLVAIEIDRALAAELPLTIASHAPLLADRVAVVTADALQVAGRDLPTMPSVLVANLPYNVAVPVLLHLLAALPTLRRGLVMVQAEVAGPDVRRAWVTSVRRAIGEAGLVRGGPAGRAGTAHRVLAGAERGLPPGRVYQASYPPATAASREEVFAVIGAAFRQRRKTLRAALSDWAGSAPAAERLLRAADIDPGARGESLGVGEFARLAAVHREGSSCNGSGSA